MFSLQRLKGIFFLGFVFFYTLSFSQNLVLNPSFENYKKCPIVLGNFNADVTHWNTPTLGSTDYFNTCSNSMGAPKNFKGSQQSNFGNGYSGLFLYAPADYREYIQTKLDAPLEKGVLYTLSFYVSLADKSDTAIKEFGILFTQNTFQVPIKKELSKMHLSKVDLGSKTYLEIGYSNFFKDTRDWINVHTQFIAKGNEQYLTIGNYKSNKRTRKFSVKKSTGQGAYYYIDMIKVSPSKPLANGNNTPVYALEETHTFKKVHFQFNSCVLEDTAKNELVRLAQYLKTNTELIISIAGHTDAVGEEDYNLKLSKERARSVTEYLVRSGVLLSRIQWKGYGSKDPIEQSKKGVRNNKNRRVEFVISKPK